MQNFKNYLTFENGLLTTFMCLLFPNSSQAYVCATEAGTAIATTPVRAAQQVKRLQSTTSTVSITATWFPSKPLISRPRPTPAESLGNQLFCNALQPCQGFLDSSSNLCIFKRAPPPQLTSHLSSHLCQTTRAIKRCCRAATVILCTMLNTFPRHSVTCGVHK
jgi:hypothetical protein